MYFYYALIPTGMNIGYPIITRRRYTPMSDLVIIRTPRSDETQIVVPERGFVPLFPVCPPVLGESYQTACEAQVRVISLHDDGDAEVTVVKDSPVLHPNAKPETRGVRVGSSYIVDKFGAVKPGHCAPPLDMDLMKRLYIGTDHSRPGSDTTDTTKVQYPPAYDDTKVRKELVQLLSAHKVEVAGVFDELQTSLRTYVKKELEAATEELNQNHARRTKELADIVKVRDDDEDKYITNVVEGIVRTHVIGVTRTGDVWSTPNGSWVKIICKHHDGSLTGKVIRGGSVLFGCEQTFAYDQKGHPATRLIDSSHTDMDLQYRITCGGA